MISIKGTVIIRSLATWKEIHPLHLMSGIQYLEKFLWVYNIGAKVEWICSCCYEKKFGGDGCIPFLRGLGLHPMGMKRTLSILFICSSLFFLAGCSTFVSLAKKEGELLTAEKKKEENKNEADEVKIASEDNETVTDEDLNLKLQPDTDFSSPDNEKGLRLDDTDMEVGSSTRKAGQLYP